MSQVQNEQTLLREVLRIMATTPEPRNSYEPVLRLGVEAMNARGGFLLVFSEPRLFVPYNVTHDDLPPDAVIRMSLDMTPPWALDSYHRLYAGIEVDDDLVAVWGMVFSERTAPFDGGECERLEILGDSFSIITKAVRSNARHEKLARNQNEFMRIVSHDLRSPLTSMQGFGSMLESGMMGDLTEKQAHFIDRMLAGVTQMTALVDNIQDAGRYDPETGFYEMQRTPCDLAEIVDRIVANHLVPAEKQELTVSKQIADDIPIINADSTMLERAITNLVDNAIKYTPNGRAVTVKLYREDDQLIVAVEDSGFGISAENQKNLFERHVRIPRIEHKRVKGSGLGLFIVRSVARRHGGEAWVESEEGRGSTFFISVPLISQNLLVG